MSLLPIVPGSIEDWQRLQNNYRYACEGFDFDVLDAFPAQELVSVSEVIKNRWAQVEKARDGRFVALRSDKIWRIISSFGLPYPAFDFDDPTDIADVGRLQAEKLGLIGIRDKVEAPIYFVAPEKIFAPPIDKPPRRNIGFRPGWQ